MVYSETRFVDDGEGHWFKDFALPAILGTGIGVALVAVTNLAAISLAAPPLTSAHVQVDLPNGHGSATHIGDGLYVTAAHVVDGKAEVEINGTTAAVLWSNAEYDIALLSGPDKAASVPLACYSPKIGERGVAHGNPMDFTDITTELTVAGAARQIAHWKVALPMDGTMGPGMSGGGFVIGGALVGVNVGAALAPAGGLPSYFGLSIVVPASVVCELMGRA